MDLTSSALDLLASDDLDRAVYVYTTGGHRIVGKCQGFHDDAQQVLEISIPGDAVEKPRTVLIAADQIVAIGVDAATAEAEAAEEYEPPSTPWAKAALPIFRIWRASGDLRYEEAASLAALEKAMRGRREYWDPEEVRELTATESELKPFKVMVTPTVASRGRRSPREGKQAYHLVLAVDARDAENLWRSDPRRNGTRVLQVARVDVEAAYTVGGEVHRVYDLAARHGKGRGVFAYDVTR